MITRRRTLRNGMYGLALYLAAIVVAVVGVAVLSTCASPAYAGDTASTKVQIPERSAIYRITLQREAVRNFGLDAPVARLAAQVHQESAWRPDARSPYANGLTQFTPSTAAWLPEVCPAVGTPDPWDPDWALRAMACYDAWLYDRIDPIGSTPLSTCSRWAYTLRAYNGGAGWLKRERRKAAANGADANDWRAVEPYRVRAGWAHRENTRYPQRILLLIEPAYLAAGWPGGDPC